MAPPRSSSSSSAGECVARYAFLLSGAVLCTLGFVVAFNATALGSSAGGGPGGSDITSGAASYLFPIVKNAHKPFGWGVDEAVEALEESARNDNGGTEAGLPAVVPPESPDEEVAEAKEKEEGEGEGEGEEAGGRRASSGSERADPERAAEAKHSWHEHGTKRKLNRLPGAREPLYPACGTPPTVPTAAGQSLEDDLAYMIERVESSPTFDYPFKSYTYFCDVWPPHLWESLNALFPPTSVFDRLERNVKRQVRGTGGARKSPYQRYQLNAQEVAGRKRRWRSSGPAGTAWRRALELLYHPRFEAAIWKKFGLTRKARSREARILVDKDGKAVGRIHPDTTYKILTMQFYFPVSNASFWDYGTCVHTRAQQARRDVKKDEEGDCWAKFAYQPNSGYSFYISRHSYHSSPNSRVFNNGDRRTMLVNWYHT